MSPGRAIILVTLMTIASFTELMAQRKSPVVKQSAEVIQAYHVCEQFQKILSERLDFNAAYDATFITNKARQRALAIKEGEFGDIDFTGVDDQILIDAYRSRMQLVYLMLPLASPSDSEETLFFPPDIKAILERKGPEKSQDFSLYAAQVERDAQDFRVHLDKLTRSYSSVAERLRKFRSDLVTGNFQPPNTTVVKPLKYSGGGGVLSDGESYYQIEGYTVVRENGQMKIAGIRFFTRLF